MFTRPPNATNAGYTEQLMRFQQLRDRQTVASLDWAIFFLFIASIVVAAVPTFGIIMWIWGFIPCLTIFILGVVQICKGGTMRGIAALFAGGMILPICLYITPLVTLEVKKNLRRTSESAATQPAKPNAPLAK